ncbi:MAG: hypothetical protein E7389_05430 [Ruminococcaceae bacterium]|nr:hypothetical protein [Oscillospiraceae bacterium]
MNDTAFNNTNVLKIVKKVFTALIMFFIIVVLAIYPFFRLLCPGNNLVFIATPERNIVKCFEKNFDKFESVKNYAFTKEYFKWWDYYPNHVDENNDSSINLENLPKEVKNAIKQLDNFNIQDIFTENNTVIFKMWIGITDYSGIVYSETPDIDFGKYTEVTALNETKHKNWYYIRCKVY